MFVWLIDWIRPYSQGHISFLILQEGEWKSDRIPWERSWNLKANNVFNQTGLSQMAEASCKGSLDLTHQQRKTKILQDRSIDHKRS